MGELCIRFNMDANCHHIRCHYWIMSKYNYVLFDALLVHVQIISVLQQFSKLCCGLVFPIPCHVNPQYRSVNLHLHDTQ